MKTFIIRASFDFRAENLDDAFSKLAQHFLDLREGKDSHLIEGGSCNVYHDQLMGLCTCDTPGHDEHCQSRQPVDPNACNPFNAQVRLIEGKGPLENEGMEQEIEKRWPLKVETCSICGKKGCAHLTGKTPRQALDPRRLELARARCSIEAMKEAGTVSLAEYERLLKKHKEDVDSNAKLCPKCYTPMDATPSTPPYMDCNTWTCPECGNVEPEIASGKL